MPHHGTKYEVPGHPYFLYSSILLHDATTLQITSPPFTVDLSMCIRGCDNTFANVNPQSCHDCPPAAFCNHVTFLQSSRRPINDEGLAVFRTGLNRSIGERRSNGQRAAAENLSEFDQKVLRDGGGRVVRCGGRLIFGSPKLMSSMPCPFRCSSVPVVPP